MLIYHRFRFELSNKDYFDNETVYEQILQEHGLDPMESYDHANHRVQLLEAVYTVLQMLANDIDSFRKVETEFVTTSAAYQYLQKRLKDVRAEIDRLKWENNTASSVVHHLFYNA